MLRADRLIAILALLVLASSGTALGKAISVSIGLNSVDPNHYQGWSGHLEGCEGDARDMAALAQQQGFAATTILTASATRSRLMAEIANAANALAPGDIFLLTYSGHGGQIKDEDGDEPTGKDSTWCLFDGEVIDDELALQWTTFKPGVRIVVVADSCHSGTSIKEFIRRMQASHQRPPGITDKVLAELTELTATTRDPEINTALSPVRTIPPLVQSAVLEANKAFYSRIEKETPSQKVSEGNTKAAVLLMAACQDNELSYDGPENGAFTGSLKVVWNKGSYKGDYDKFIAAIATTVATISPQHPRLFGVGTGVDALKAQQPFLAK